MNLRAVFFLLDGIDFSRKRVKKAMILSHLGRCREHAGEMDFNRFAQVTYVEGNVQGRNYIDMCLMSKCKRMIVSNSTFCCLAALLNTRRYPYTP